MAIAEGVPRVRLRDARARLSAMVDQAARHRPTVLTRHSADVAAIVPVTALNGGPDAPLLLAVLESSLEEQRAEADRLRAELAASRARIAELTEQARVHQAEREELARQRSDLRAAATALENARKDMAPPGIWAVRTQQRSLRSRADLERRYAAAELGWAADYAALWTYLTRIAAAAGYRGVDLGQRLGDRHARAQNLLRQRSAPAD